MTPASLVQTLRICRAPEMAPGTPDWAPASKQLDVLVTPKRWLEILISQIRKTDLIQEHRTANCMGSNGLWGFEVQECQTIWIMFPETSTSMGLQSAQTALFGGGFSNGSSNFFFKNTNEQENQTWENVNFTSPLKTLFLYLHFSMSNVLKFIKKIRHWS